MGGVDVHEVRDRQADRRPERDQRGLGAEHRAEGQRADGRQGHARHVGDGRRRRGAEAVQRAVAAVSREQPSRREHQGGADHREADHEEPRRRVVAERVRQVVPEPVLQLVDQRQEDRREERGRDADQRAEPDQLEVLRGR